jgi:pyridoxal phosphate-dependent aminotransferase EpsN
MTKKIWLSPPHMGENELKYIHEAFENNWIAPVGPNIDAFEKQLGILTGSKYLTALSSGTAAIHLALLTLDVAQDDIVLCQSLTFAATANPIVYLKAIPVFIDSEPASWNICQNALEDAIKYYIKKGKKPKAVVGVHLYGMPMQLTEILDVCSKYDIPLIEDAAEALGSKYKKKAVGTFAELGIFSFNGNKIITTSGGGALLSGNPKLIARAKFLSTQAKDEALHFEHSQIGYNYGMSNVCAGIGLGQLELIGQRVAQRRANFDFYQQELKDLPGVKFQNEPGDCFSNRWLTTILINPDISGGITREIIRLALDKKNIESRPVWKPMHLQPVYRNATYFGGNISDKLFEEGLCLPSGSGLTAAELQSIADCIRACF